MPCLVNVSVLFLLVSVVIFCTALLVVPLVIRTIILARSAWPATGIAQLEWPAEQCPAGKPASLVSRIFLGKFDSGLLPLLLYYQGSWDIACLLQDFFGEGLEAAFGYILVK